jgi:hypothetical protein
MLPFMPDQGDQLGDFLPIGQILDDYDFLKK